MRVNVQVSFRLDVQIEHSMFCEQCEHVIQKTDTRCDPGNTGSVEIQADLNFGSGGLSIDGRGA